MLISSLPPAYQTDLLARIAAHPVVDAVRYNTGMSSPYDPAKTIEKLLEAVDPRNKPLYIDLKGKQLRIVEWANLPEGSIRLNHAIKVTGSAKVFFRGDDVCNLVEVVNGNEIYVDPLPKAPVGRGQAINIIAERVEIEGGLLDLDRAYVQAALRLGIRRFMLSFVESKEDVRELEAAIAECSRGAVAPEECEIVFKIESASGVEFVNILEHRHFSEGSPYRLMAARDDLLIQTGLLRMGNGLKDIAKKDPRAICASRLLLGLECGAVSVADLSDIEYMRSLGYQDFMLSDEISREYAAEAFAFWQAYIAAHPF